jgi:hypothetical protein
MTDHEHITGGLGADGLALVEGIIAAMDRADCDPDARESALLRAAGECRDRLTEIGARIDAEGLTVSAGAGGVKAHPLLAEERQREAVIAKLLAGVVLVDSTGKVLKSARHVNAVNARWSRERAKNG